MKFSREKVVVALAYAATAHASSPPQILPVLERSSLSLANRDLPTIVNAITAVNDNIKKLDTAVVAFSATDAKSLTALNDAASGLTSALKSNTATVQATQPITLQEALQLQQQVTGLQGDGTSLINDLTAKKTAIEQAGLCDVVRQQTADISTNSKSLIDAIVSKVPEAAQTIAAQMAAGFTTTLQQTQATFAQGNCTNGASGGSAGTSTLSNATTTGGTTKSTTTVNAGSASIANVAASVMGFAIAVTAALL